LTKSKSINLIKLILALAIILFILFKKIDMRGLLASLRSIPPGRLFGLWLFYCIVCLLSVNRWRILLRIQNIVVRYIRLLEFYFIGLFFNNIMLGSVGGDVVKAYYTTRAVPYRKEAAIVTVFSDRLLGFISYLGIGLVGFFMNITNPDLRPARYLFLVILFVALSVLLLAYNKSLLKKIPFAVTILKRVPFEKNIRRLYESFYLYRAHLSELCRAFLLSVVLQLIAITIVYCIARSLGIEQLAFKHLLILIPLIGTVLAIPVTPSGWGTGEVAFLQLFKLLRVAKEQALALDFVMRGVIISWGLLGGIIYAMPRWKLPESIIEKNAAET
jgi:uncharacterized protein (TIRG00374 family)